MDHLDKEGPPRGRDGGRYIMSCHAAHAEQMTLGIHHITCHFSQARSDPADPQSEPALETKFNPIGTN